MNLNSCYRLQSDSPVLGIYEMEKLVSMDHDEFIKLLMSKKYKLSSDTTIHKQRVTELSYSDGQYKLEALKTEVLDGKESFSWIHLNILPKTLENKYYHELDSAGFKILSRQAGEGMRSVVYKGGNVTVNISQFGSDKIPLTVSYQKIEAKPDF